MSKIKDNILKLINKIFNRSTNSQKVLPPSRLETILQEFTSSGIVRDFEKDIDNGINITRLDAFYGKKLENEKSIYNMPLVSRLSEMQTIELAKQFFKNLGTDLSNNAIQVIECKSSKFKFIFEKYGKSLDNKGNPREAEVSNFSEIYCPRRDDLRDLYSIVHEVTHTFDLENGDTESRKIFGEIAPQCMERMLDEYLLNLNDKDIQKYGLNRTTLIQDVRNRQVSTFLSRKDNIKYFNNRTENQELDLRYILAQIYSFAFMKQDKKTRVDSLVKFMKNIANNEFDSCSKAFGVDLKNKIKTQLLMQEIINNVRNTHNQIVLQEKLQEILEKSKSGKNFIEILGNQNIHINLESKIPFVLITPSTLKNTQTLVMESNNLETNNIQSLLRQALSTEKDLNDILKGSNPILIPILPSESPSAPYYQQLSAECFQNGERPDLNVVEAINKAKEIMKNQYNVNLNDKIFLNGYSSSGCFAQRFSLIHPELIDTACIGGASGSIPIPNLDLDYPLGIKNYEELFGKKFDIEEYKKITFNYYVGSLECETKSSDRTDENGNLAPMHDMSYFDRSVPTDVGESYRKILGQNMFERAKNAVAILRNNEINISHTIIPNIAHNNNEALKLAQKNPLYKNARGIRSSQEQIILSTFNKMKQRDISKENNDTLIDHD